MSNCCIIGLGYIGLPTAALIAMSNQNVIGVDINQNILEMIRNGHVHFYEPGLLEILKKVISNKKMTVSNKPTYADVFIIAVPTFNLICVYGVAERLYIFEYVWVHV